MSPSLCFRRTCLLLLIFLLFPLLKAEAIQMSEDRERPRPKKVRCTSGNQRGAQAPIVECRLQPDFAVSGLGLGILSFLWVARCDPDRRHLHGGRVGRDRQGGVPSYEVRARRSGVSGCPGGCSRQRGVRRQLERNPRHPARRRKFPANRLCQKNATAYLLTARLLGNCSGKAARLRGACANETISAGTMAVQRAMQNFDSVLAEVKPPAPPSLDVTLHAEPALGGKRPHRDAGLDFQQRHQP